MRLFIIFLLLPLYPFCQNQMVSKSDGTAMVSSRYERIEGTPYLSDRYAECQLKYWQSQKILTFNTARFDAYKQCLEYIDEKGALKVLDAKHIQEFVLDGKIFRCGYEPVEALQRTDFVQVLYEGKIQLLKLNKTKLDTEMVFGSVSNPSRFTPEEFYFLKDEQQIRRIKPFNLKWLKLLGSHEKMILDFMKTSGMKTISNDDELTAIVKYYDTLPR